MSIMIGGTNIGDLQIIPLTAGSAVLRLSSEALNLMRVSACLGMAESVTTLRAAVLANIAATERLFICTRSGVVMVAA